MNPTGPESSAASPAENPLRAELARAERVLAAIPPVLSHLVANRSHAVFSEEIVARTRGQVESLAFALVRGLGEGASPTLVRPLAGQLADQPALLAHCHALALESQLAERLARDAGMDPVLSPLLQDCIAAPVAETAATAMKLLAAQARFIHAQRRMELAVDELPADLLADVLAAFTATCGVAALPAADRLRHEFDEARGRVALLARVALAAEPAIAAGLALDRAGLALFLTTMSLATGEDRAAVALATSDGQQARLALMLAIAGLATTDAEAILLRLHPDAAVPRGLLGLGREEAMALLGEGRAR